MTPFGSSGAERNLPSPFVPEPPGISPLEILGLVARQKRIVGAAVLAGVVLTVGYRLVVSPTYSATTIFVTQAKSQSSLPGALGGIAAQLGVVSEASESPRFFAEVVRSRPILESVLRLRFADPRSGAGHDSATLLQILGANDKDSSAVLYRGVRLLTPLVSTRVDVQTSMVHLTVQSKYPTIASEVANRLVSKLNDFNSERRQSQAHMRRVFVEARVTDAERNLRSAEEELKSFLQENRSYQGSPQLLFEEGRLRRRVEILNEVFLTLRRENEVARIDEVNDTPVITIIEPAIAPRDGRGQGWVFALVLGLVLGSSFGVVAALMVEYIAGAPSRTYPDVPLAIADPGS